MAMQDLTPREDNAPTGTSCTIVLCGAETPKRKFVDWEIKAILDKGHPARSETLSTYGNTLHGNREIPQPAPERVAEVRPGNPEGTRHQH
jgi:hypothetical protein